MRKNLNLKIAIIKTGKWQSDIAYEAKVSYDRISPFINGYAKPRPDEARQLAQILGCKVEDIFPEEWVQQ